MLISLSFRSFTRLLRAEKSAQKLQWANLISFFKRFLVLNRNLYHKVLHICGTSFDFDLLIGISSSDFAKRNVLFNIRAFRSEFLFFLIHHDQHLAWPYLHKTFVWCLVCLSRISGIIGVINSWNRSKVQSSVSENPEAAH